MKAELQVAEYRKRTFELLGNIRSPLFEEETALKKGGFIICRIRPLTYEEVVNDWLARRNVLHYFKADEQWGIDWRTKGGNISLKEWKLPVETQVAIMLTPKGKEDDLRFKPVFQCLEGDMKGNRRFSLAERIRMVEDYSRTFQGQYPDVRAVIPPAVMLAQICLSVGDIFNQGHLLYQNPTAILDELPGAEVDDPNLCDPGLTPYFNFGINYGTWHDYHSFKDPRICPVIIFVNQP